MMISMVFVVKELTHRLVQLQKELLQIIKVTKVTKIIKNNQKYQKYQYYENIISELTNQIKSISSKFESEIKEMKAAIIPSEFIYVQLPNLAEPNSIWPNQSVLIKLQVMKNLKCGVTLENNINAKIIGGHETVKGNWPWMVLILNSQHNPWCAGTLIASQIVLRAGNLF